MLIALTAYLIYHFGSHAPAVTTPLDQTAALIQKNVTDETHQKQALAIVDHMKATIKASAEQSSKTIDSLNDLLAKRTTPASQIGLAAQPLIAEDRASAEKLLDLRFQLKSVLTPSEWAKVFPPPVSQAKSARRAPQQIYGIPCPDFLSGTMRR